MSRNNWYCMEEVMHHPGCIIPCKSWDIYHINWCRISFINTITFQTFFGFCWLLQDSEDFPANLGWRQGHIKRQSRLRDGVRTTWLALMDMLSWLQYQNRNMMNNHCSRLSTIFYIMDRSKRLFTILGGCISGTKTKINHDQAICVCLADVGTCNRFSQWGHCCNLVGVIRRPLNVDSWFLKAHPHSSFSTLSRPQGAY